MAEKQYIQCVVGRTPRPRSKRLQEVGGSPAGTSASAVTLMGGYTVGPGHMHPNLADLSRITIDSEGYLCLSDEVIDPDTGIPTIGLNRVKAGHADRAMANASGHVLDWFFPVEVDGVTALKLNPAYAGLLADGWGAFGGVAGDGLNLLQALVQRVAALEAKVAELEND